MSLTEYDGDPNVDVRREDYWETVGGSRPSETNCTSGGSDTSTVEKLTMRGRWWKRKNRIVDAFIENYANHAARPLSVRDTAKIREECTAEKAGNAGGRRARTWSACMNEFLNWYNGYRFAHLLFLDPDGNEVRSQMPNAHQPGYGDKYYARIKALERQILKEYEEPWSCMLTLSGSSENANGGLRCPVDHLLDVKKSWRPDRGRGVYHVLRDALDGRRWEYALVLEHHKSGYAHVHVAVFVDGETSKEDFHPVIDAHLRECEIAGREAHDYHHPNEEKRPISVRKFNPGLDPEEYDRNAHEVGNLGSYLGEYIGSYGEELFERSIPELMFRTAVWSTGSQMVRFSNGANELIRADRNNDRGVSDAATVPTVEPNDDFDFSDPGSVAGDTTAWDVENEGWSLAGVCTVNEDGEELHDVEKSGVQYVSIDDASHVDPPNPQPSARPRRRTRESELTGY